MEKQTTVTIPATASKGFGRGADWSVTVAGVAKGHGPTQREARDAAAQQLVELATNAATMPVLVRDDDGGVWVFTAHGTGHLGTRIAAGAVSASVGVLYGEGSPESAAERIVQHHHGAVRLA